MSRSGFRDGTFLATAGAERRRPLGKWGKINDEDNARTRVTPRPGSFVSGNNPLSSSSIGGLSFLFVPDSGPVADLFRPGYERCPIWRAEKETVVT